MHSQIVHITKHRYMDLCWEEGGKGEGGAVFIWALRTTFHRNDQKYS